MPEATHTFTLLPGGLSSEKITHRFAGAAPGASVLAALRGRVATSATMGAGTSLDAELIALCAEFEALEHKSYRAWQAAEEAGAEAQHASKEPFLDQQRALLPRMISLKATTPAAFYARARAMMCFCLSAWDGVMEEHADIANEGSWHGVMLAAFMRDAMQRDFAPLFSEIEEALS